LEENFDTENPAKNRNKVPYWQVNNAVFFSDFVDNSSVISSDLGNFYGFYA